MVDESRKIPAASTRNDFLIDCWLETLCTAEIRVLGWLYREFYGRPFHPDNFPQSSVRRLSPERF